MNSADLSRVEARLKETLGAEEGPDALAAAAAPILAQAFAVDPNEVALFVLNESGTLLNFLWPTRFKGVGFIPLSADEILAARTAREQKTFLFNDFVQTRHAVVYEQVRLERGPGETPAPIQKLISAPVCQGEQLRGVVQIARKGLRVDDVPDFTSADTEALERLARLLGGVI